MPEVELSLCTCDDDAMLLKRVQEFGEYEYVHGRDFVFAHPCMPQGAS